MDTTITGDQIFELLAQNRAGRITKDLLTAFLINPNGYSDTRKPPEFPFTYYKDIEELTVGDRTYDLLSFLRWNEPSVDGYTMVERAKAIHSYLDDRDGEYILKTEKDIPAIMRHKMVFVFPGWRWHYNGDEYIKFVYFINSKGVGPAAEGQWWTDCKKIDSSWNDQFRLLRRRK